MKKAFGAILIAVILIVCVVTLTVQRGENAMLEFPERPAEGCTVLSLEITDGKAQTEVIGTYNVNENVLTMTSTSDKEWTDYVGGKASAEDRKSADDEHLGA